MKSVQTTYFQSEISGAGFDPGQVLLGRVHLMGLMLCLTATCPVTVGSQSTARLEVSLNDQRAGVLGSGVARGGVLGSLFLISELNTTNGSSKTESIYIPLGISLAADKLIYIFLTHTGANATAEGVSIFFFTT